MLRRKRVVLDHIEGGADRGISGALKDGPQSEVVAVPRSERDAVELGRGVKVGGHLLGEGPRSAVLERGRIEVVKAQQVGQGNKPGAQSRDGLGGGHRVSLLSE